MNINELRKIIENAPEWSTHIENGYKIIYWNLNQLASPKWFDGEGWYSGMPSGLVHSLSDIKTIIELHDTLSHIHKAGSWYPQGAFENFGNDWEGIQKKIESALGKLK